MKKNIIAIGLAALLAGCAGQYDFYPDSKSNSTAVEVNKEEQRIVLDGGQSSLIIESLEEKIGPWTAPKMKFTIKNKTDKQIMNFQASNIQLGFNNFWFPIKEYNIVRKGNQFEDFSNDENFRMIHEVLPGQEIVIEATFKTPKSQEYYEKKDILVEVYTNLGLYNVMYKIKKDIY